MAVGTRRRPSMRSGTYMRSQRGRRVADHVDTAAICAVQHAATRIGARDAELLVDVLAGASCRIAPCRTFGRARQAAAMGGENPIGLFASIQSCGSDPLYSRSLDDVFVELICSRKNYVEFSGVRADRVDLDLCVRVVSSPDRAPALAISAAHRSTCCARLCRSNSRPHRKLIAWTCVRIPPVRRAETECDLGDHAEHAHPLSRMLPSCGATPSISDRSVAL